MPRIFNLQRLILASAAFAIMVMASSTAWADPITITTGNPNNQNTDNVLFNNGSLSHSGTLVQGDFNGAGAGFIVDFTSASGNGNLGVSGGQAVLVGGTGNARAVTDAQVQAALQGAPSAFAELWQSCRPIVQEAVTRARSASATSGGGDSNVSMPGIRAKNGANVGFEATMMRAPRFASSGM